ncbi:MAG TPA: ester cyclase [Bryobacteraceae bacterium]|nr:ester cyclase [Bryobacteraceae bacterium]HTF67554.1 ester cyclase [Edaphobacter sp.]
MSDENKKIARKFMEEGWNKGRMEVIDEVMSTACRFHDPVFPSLTAGVENFKEHIRTCRSAFPDLKFTIEDMIAERNEVVLHWMARGTHRGMFLGMPATEKNAAVSGTTICRIDKGKIAEQWVDWNLLTLMEQLGLATASPPHMASQPHTAKLQR